jgi:hypothetical protein
MGCGGRHLGVVERRSDLDDVHRGQLDAADDLADRAQELTRQHPARLGRARAGAIPGSMTSISTDR